MDNIIKFVLDSDIMEQGLIPIVLIVLFVILCIAVTIILVNNELRGVKNEKN